MSTEIRLCVGALVLRGDRILAIRQAAGHPLEGLWTFPWGRLEPGESPSAAALREAREEAGVVAEIRGLIGVQEMPAPWVGWNAFVYLCDHLSGEPTPDNRETDASQYLSLKDLDLLSDSIEVWSLWVMTRALQNTLTVIRQSEENPYKPSPGYL